MSLQPGCKRSCETVVGDAWFGIILLLSDITEGAHR